MYVGYCVAVQPSLASYRLRVELPSKHLGVGYAIGCTGKPTYFYKNGISRLAEALTNGVVYDVVNDHFRGKHAADYHAMCSIADSITVGSAVMADVVREHTGRDSTIIDDPYENEELPAACVGDDVLWFGHSANIGSIEPYADSITTVCSNVSGAVPWSRQAEDDCLSGAAVVVMTGTNPGATANRLVKTLRAGRFVVAPKDCAESWRELAPYIWLGDVSEGIRWALNNREDVCQKITQGQEYVAQRYSPQLIGSQWADLFASTWEPGQSAPPDG
jgi:hypothetical protein